MTKRLIGWFFLLIAITVFSMGWRINQTAGETFRSFRGDHTQAHLNDLPHTLSHYYLNHESWDGVQETVASYGGVLSMQAVLVDPQARVIATTGLDPIGELYIDTDWAEEIVLIEHPLLGVPIGTLYLARSHELRQADDLFFKQLLRESILTAVIIGLVATAVSTFIARSITAPLKRMSNATEAVRNGNYNVRIVTHTDDEIGLLSKAFNQMAAEIGKLEQVRRDLVINVSHDFRTPLTVVHGYLEALQSGKIADRRSAERAFGSMAIEIEHLQTMIGALNEVAALDAGHIPLTPTPADIGELIRNAAKRVEWHAQDKQITLHLDYPEPAPIMQLDTNKINQLLFNLLDNAIHYTQENGAVSVQARKIGTGLQLKVTDNGEGILAEHQPFIFERFYRAGSSKNRVVDGYGMGLSIARSVVQLHGGRIEVESSGVYGEGCCFTMTLPNL